MPTDRTPERKALVRFIEDAIEKGATTVEDVHNSIAQLPLTILEESAPFPGARGEVRRIQDHTIGAIYDLLWYIDEQVEILAEELLNHAARRRGARREAEHHAASSTSPRVV